MLCTHLLCMCVIISLRKCVLFFDKRGKKVFKNITVSLLEFFDCLVLRPVAIYQWFSYRWFIIGKGIFFLSRGSGWIQAIAPWDCLIPTFLSAESYCTIYTLFVTILVKILWVSQASDYFSFSFSVQKVFPPFKPVGNFIDLLRLKGRVWVFSWILTITRHWAGCC